jgi:hypothetical protein
MLSARISELQTKVGWMLMPLMLLTEGFVRLTISRASEFSRDTQASSLFSLCSLYLSPATRARAAECLRKATRTRQSALATPPSHFLYLFRAGMSESQLVR